MSIERPVLVKPRPLAFAFGVTKEATPRPLRRAFVRGLLRVSRRTLRGSAVTCPVCETSASAFLRGRICVGCGANPRTRLIGAFVRRELLDGGSRHRVLHFAPEPGLVSHFSSSPNVDYVPGDLNPDRGHARVDATQISLPGTFDGVITSHVLEHIPDDKAAICEMYRVLNPGGWAVVLTPVHEPLDKTWQHPEVRSRWQRELYYGQHDHVRLYGRDFTDRLRTAGFEVDVREYARELPEVERNRMGLANEPIYHCRKPVSRQPT